jgi:hypothetical protein
MEEESTNRFVDSGRRLVLLGGAGRAGGGRLCRGERATGTCESTDCCRLAMAAWSCGSMTTTPGDDDDDCWCDLRSLIEAEAPDFVVSSARARRRAIMAAKPPSAGTTDGTGILA